MSSSKEGAEPFVMSHRVCFSKLHLFSLFFLKKKSRPRKLPPSTGSLATALRHRLACGTLNAARSDTRRLSKFTASNRLRRLTTTQTQIKNSAPRWNNMSSQIYEAGKGHESRPCRMEAAREAREQLYGGCKSSGKKNQKPKKNNKKKKNKNLWETGKSQNAGKSKLSTVLVS